MIRVGNDIFKFEKGEPVMRSCWECNEAHEHLKKVNTVHICFNCGKYWVYNRFLDSFKDDELDKWLEKKGVKKGMSTTKIDAGYRIKY